MSGTANNKNASWVGTETFYHLSCWLTLHALHASAIGNGRQGFRLPHRRECGKKAFNISIIYVNVEMYVEARLHYAVERLVFHSIVVIKMLLLTTASCCCGICFREVEVWSVLPQVNAEFHPSNKKTP